MLTKTVGQFLLFSFLMVLSSCIAQFIPEIDEEQELLVVEGLITDQPGTNTVKLSMSMPLGSKKTAKPLKGCTVWISDDQGGSFNLQENISGGTYTTDPATFQGVVGRLYTLHINTNNVYTNLNYKSLPMEMNPVPPIDSIYYEKISIGEDDGPWSANQGCQIYLNTYDPTSSCEFYRWEYSETWEFRLPYSAPVNRICWVSDNSDRINIKSTSVLVEDRITRYPLSFISDRTDRLRVKYSMLVKQYSLNEDEYSYWEKLQNISEEVGGLYDITPAAIPSNIWCIEDPNVNVLGYFSVSASSSKRIFIRDTFLGIIDLYSECITDTIYGHNPIEGLNEHYWLLEEIEEDRYARIITKYPGCADCTIRGTNIEPLFWKDGGN